jgi:hypothetical protein
MSDTRSWILDPIIPGNATTFPTQATYFGSSSLASASGSILALDRGDQMPTLYPITTGNRNFHNLQIIDTDKSALGVATRKRVTQLRFSKPALDALTVPNKFSLSRDSLL